MTSRVVLAVLLVAQAWGVRVAAQQPQGRFGYERPATAAGPGPQRLPVDTPLLVGGTPFRVVNRGQRLVAEEGLSDLRLFDGQGRQVPYLLVHTPPAEPEWLPGRVLSVQPTKKTSGFEVDFGSSETIDAISVEGIPAPFLKRLSVEGSGDRARWTSLAPEATLFDLPAEKLRQLEVGFAPGVYRYVRITWNDTNSGRVPPPRVVRSRRSARLQLPQQPPIELAFDVQPSEPGRSRYRVRLPAPRLPIIALELDVAGGHIFRAAAVTESRFSGFEAAPVELGRATLSRVVRDGVEAADLRVRVSPPNESEVQLLIDDGNNPPLGIRRILAVLADLPAIYFESPLVDLVARYGDRTLQRPAYDLEAVRPSIDIARVAEAKWGVARALIETAAAGGEPGAPQPGGPLAVSGFRYLRPILEASPGLVSLQLDAAVLSHSRGPAGRFADVRLLDNAERQIPYLIERRDEPLRADLSLVPAEASVADLKRTPGRQRSLYRITLPYQNLPPATLVLETSARLFQRTVQLGIERPPDRSHRDAWFQQLASETWRHADQHTPAGPLGLRIGSIDSSALLLIVDEGDNAPLSISAARLLLPSYRLRYYQPESPSLRLAYGRDDLQLPQYDLALLAQQVMGASPRDVAAGAESQHGQTPGAGTVISPLAFWGLLAGAVIVLVGLIARLARQ